MNKEQYKLVDRVNKKMLSWRGQERPYIIEEAETMLLNFYDKYDIAFRKGQKNVTFTKSQKLEGEALEELIAIAEMVDNAETAGRGYYRRMPEASKESINDRVKKTYQTHKKERPNLIKNPSDIVKALKKVDRLKVEIRENYSSAQLFDIFDYGYAYGLTDKQIKGVLERQAKKDYIDDSARYDQVLNRLDIMFKRKKEKNNAPLYQVPKTKSK